MYLRNGIKFDITAQHTIGETQYPRGWFLDPAECAKLGITEVPDPVRPDDNLFTFIENPDGSYTAAPRTAEDLAARELADKLTANAIIKEQLAAADLTIIRSLIENDTVRIAAHKAAQATLRSQLLA